MGMTPLFRSADTYVIRKCYGLGEGVLWARNKTLKQRSKINEVGGRGPYVTLIVRRDFPFRAEK
jgi:hypothetical protein